MSELIHPCSQVVPAPPFEFQSCRTAKRVTTTRCKALGCLICTQQYTPGSARVPRHYHLRCALPARYLASCCLDHHPLVSKHDGLKGPFRCSASPRPASTVASRTQPAECKSHQLPVWSCPHCNAVSHLRSRQLHTVSEHEPVHVGYAAQSVAVHHCKQSDSCVCTWHQRP